MSRLARRLYARWFNATAQHKAEGHWWYKRARRDARRMARLHGCTLSTAAGVIAALSPRLHWDVNLRAAERLLGSEDVTGVFMDNLVKAQRIFAGERPLSVLSGPKVRAFYRAILGQDAAVVDVWVARAAGIQRELTPQRYSEAARALTQAARMAGVPTTTLQATVWVAERGRP